MNRYTLIPVFIECKSEVDEDDDDDDEDAIGGEGIMKFAEDLSIDPMSMTLLVIMWKLGAKVQYKISRKEFIDGFQNMG